MTTLKPHDDIPKHQDKARRLAIILNLAGILVWGVFTFAGAAYLLSGWLS